MCGTTKSWATLAQWGWDSNSNGICRTETAMNTNIARSQRRKLPLAMIAIRATAAVGTTMYLLNPMKSAASDTPMNSVTIVRKFNRNRSPTLNLDPPRRFLRLAEPT